jgi:multiple antibiotic resistance protein
MLSLHLNREMTISINSLILFFLSLIGLFSPLAGIASMANITSLYSTEVQRKIAIRMVVSIALLLTLITWVGQALLQLLGVTTAQLTAAGGLALMLVAIPMMTGKVEMARDDHEPDEEGKSWQSIVVMPLIFPLSVGASTVAIVISTSSRYDTVIDLIAISLACALFALVVGITNYFSGPLNQRLSPQGRDIMSRLAGIILVAIAFGLLTKGITEIALDAGIKFLEVLGS